MRLIEQRDAHWVLQALNGEASWIPRPRLDFLVTLALSLLEASASIWNADWLSPRDLWLWPVHQ